MIQPQFERTVLPTEEKRACAQALGRSRGGPTTKIHALSDEEGRPVAFHLTGGNVSDFKGAEPLLLLIPRYSILHGDKGYDSDHIRRADGAVGIFGTFGTLPNIPPKANRKWKNCFSPRLYRKRNVIERIFGSLEEWRKIATKYDRSAKNYLAALSIAATISY